MARIVVAMVLALLAFTTSAHAQVREIKDCDQCPTVVVIPPGKFQRSDTAVGTPFPVEIKRPFAIAKYEVTVGQFRAFVADTGAAITGCTQWRDLGPKDNPAATWDNAFPTKQADTEPVVCVSWDDVDAYVEWLRRKSGEPYRLATEAEWEYSARAGGPNTSTLWLKANLNANGANCQDCGGNSAMGHIEDLKVFPVGRFPGNAFGLFDMYGNAAEWVDDCYNRSLEKAPRDGTAWLDGDCNLHVTRGGGWRSEWATIGGFREGVEAKKRLNDTGFRVAKSLPE